jgi:predicted metal-dependent hydrolase
MWPFLRPQAARARKNDARIVKIELDGSEIAIKVTPHAAARRMTLRLSRNGETFVLTVPRRHSRKAAEDFIAASHGWMRATRARLPAMQEVADGACLYFKGEAYTLRATNKLRGIVSLDNATREITVPGGLSHMQRRLKDWLKREAERELSETSRRYAMAMAVSFKKLSVRDQKSRWGSCTSDGALSYSWRLILAPPMVLDYVVAHEVAHLRELNHGPRFWRLVLTHCSNARAAKQWLRRNGQSLHRML